MLEWIDLGKLVHDWADHASVAGVLVSLVGFAFTIVQIVRSRSKAQEIATAVKGVERNLALREAVIDLNRVLNEVEELKLLHREGAWAVLPSRYSSLRKQLLSVKALSGELTARQRAKIQGIIQRFADIEEIVEVALLSKQPPNDVAELNRIAREQGDALSAILVTVQRDLGA